MSRVQSFEDLAPLGNRFRFSEMAPKKSSAEKLSNFEIWFQIDSEVSLNLKNDRHPTPATPSAQGFSLPFHPS